jgi:hypothetical protein
LPNEIATAVLPKKPGDLPVAFKMAAREFHVQLLARRIAENVPEI